MGTDLLQRRQVAHLIIDSLPEEKMDAAYNFLEVLREPTSDPFDDVSYEDEKLKPEMVAALESAYASVEADGGISHEEMMREFGL